MSVLQFHHNELIFKSKASAVPYNYRISYRVALICMIIGKCCGRKGCSAIKMQIINAALGNNKAKSELLLLIKKRFALETTLVRFDPVISRAINFAIADNLIYRQGNGLYRLTEKGKNLIKAIYTDVTLMQVEKELINDISDQLSEDIIMQMAENWRMNYAEN